MREAVLVLSLILTAAFPACAIGPVSRAREAMEQSRDAYMECVGRNSETPANCNELKAVFDENMKEYMVISNP